MNSPRAAHFIFETLGYGIGFRLYLIARRKEGDFLPTEARTWLVVAAILGAASCFFSLEDHPHSHKGAQPPGQGTPAGRSGGSGPDVSSQWPVLCSSLQ